MKMNNNALSKIVVSCCALSAAFSVSALSFHADISLLAFPFAAVYTLVLSYFAVSKLFGIRPGAASSGGDPAFIPAVRTMMQYEPFVLLISFVLRRAGDEGTPYALDCIEVFLWCAVSVLVLVVLHFISPKSIRAWSPVWHQVLVDRKYEARKGRFGRRWLLVEALGWVDALVQAVFMVLLLNIFLVQLYEIPSESMVPEFLVKDRVVVFKVLNGPKFPLSDIGLPPVKKYGRGDIVVFRNPHYSADRKSEVRTFVSQLVFMCTLTMKNINVDESGMPKADPLVKRVVGVPGEQLVMVDGRLYSRTKDSPSFSVVEDDASWACWNLNAVKEPVKKGIREFVLSADDVAAMERVERAKSALSVEEAREKCAAIADEFDSLVEGGSVSARKFGGGGEFSLSPRELFSFAYFDGIDRKSVSLFNAANRSEWFREFMTGWCASVPDFGDDMYAESNFKLNLLFKMKFGSVVVKNVENLLAGVPMSLWDDGGSEKDDLVSYVELLDRRSMPVFPASASDGTPSYIPENCYFMMGDNRFNSLDMRHSYEPHLASLAESDKFGVLYPSNIAPMYVPRSKILGVASYRFWPVSRKGVPGHTGM